MFRKKTLLAKFDVSIELLVVDLFPFLRHHFYLNYKKQASKIQNHFNFKQLNFKKSITPKSYVNFKAYLVTLSGQYFFSSTAVI